MLASSISQGDRGFCVGAPHGLQLGFRCEVIHALLMLSDSLHCAFIPGPSLPLTMVSMW